MKNTFNWKKYIGHIYNIRNNTKNVNNERELEKYNISNSGIFSYEYYNIGNDWNSLKYFKQAKLFDVIKDAYNKKYENILIIWDECIFNEYLYKNIYKNSNKAFYILNPGDIREDCWIISKHTIEKLFELNYDFSDQNWLANFESIISTYNTLNNRATIPVCKHRIDYVISYVDNSDKEWQKEYEKFTEEAIGTYNLSNRWQAQDDIFKLHIENVNKHMPWINNIYVVVSSLSQVPEWLTGNNINIILHKDIVPLSCLPTFNSRTIEMFLHNINGISEYYLYANDDMLVLKDIDAKLYYDGNYIYDKWQSIPNVNTNYHTACKNGLALINDEIHVQKTDIKFKHIPHPMLLSSSKHIYVRYCINIFNSITRFRSSNNFNQYIFLYYEYFIGLRKPMNGISYKFINNNKQNYELTDIIKSVNNYVFTCINDSYIKNFTNLKVAVCAIAKNENLYIREWVEWYKDLGICKIFLYDNNDLDGERFEEVINDYIEEGFVEVIDKRGVTITIDTDKTGETLQGLCYEDCYNGNYYKYNWICFFDCDEYLTIDYKYNNIHEFLYDYKNYNAINVQWRMYGDNNQIYYINDTLHNRFKCKENEGWDSRTKTIINTNTYYNYIFCAHGPLNYKKLNLKYVNVNFEDTLNIYRTKNIHKNLPVYLDHFYSKSTEEFFKRKYMKTSAVTGVNGNRNFNKQFLYEQYFLCNKITQDKLDFIYKYESQFLNTIETNQPEKTNIKKALIDVYVASLFRDGHIIDMLKSIINQSEVNAITVSCNNYTDDEYNKLKSEIKSSKLILKHTKNEKKSFEKLKYVNEGNSLYVAFCDDDLIYPSFYFRKMLYECSRLNSPVSYHGAKFIKLPLTNYYKERKMFSFSMNVKEKTMVDIIGNGVSLMKRDFLSKDEWKSLYNDAPDASMDDIIISYLLRKKGYNLYVVKHSTGEVYERENNKQIDTVYMTYKNNCDIQTNWVNKKFITLN